MKKLFLTLIAFLTFAGTTFAGTTFAVENDSNHRTNFVITSSCENETTVINLDISSKDEFNNFEEIQLLLEDFCTVDVSVTVSVGVSSTSASVTLTAKDIPCDSVASTIRELTRQARISLSDAIN
ncbi:hypothetical protein NBT05_04355 [Aquimarina sp. ERC-38]|uniref:hypothetical protein n=1 Tax=Aquimarina sp. ERC-38 TaxID=2949996 RepID=UPI0022464377|nr:hypothetical protein [Aquimarina sp. ERC-38]UZO81705.1 hypothetical protein NBT05_04355 [Aquimarina sp. ERC-38]